MKIALHDYGGFPFTLQLAENLAKKGIIVHYFHGGTMQPLMRARSSTLIPNLHISTTAINSVFQKYNYLHRWQQEQDYGRRLEEEIHKVSPDIIVSSVCPLESQKYITRYARRNHKQFVFWWQDITGEAVQKIFASRNKAVGSVLGGYYSLMEKKQLAMSDKVISISEEFRATYKRWGLDQDKFFVLRNWAPVDEISVMDKKNKWSLQNGLADTFNFIYTGMLGLKHDPQKILDLAEHFQKAPQVRVVVVSESPGAEWLKHNPRENLIILPFQKQEDYAEVLASADVLLAVLRDHAGHYSVPSKTHSYLCAGRPILISASLDNQASQLVESLNCGLVAAPEDTGFFLSNADQLFQNVELRMKMGTNGRDYAVKAFDIEHITERFIKIIQ